MLSEKDLQQISHRGISEKQVINQLDQIKKGFPYLRLEAAASLEKGIMSPIDEDRNRYIEAWKAYLKKGKKVVKFVPASGVASRMFKDMFAFLNSQREEPVTDFEKTFFDNITKFAFQKALCEQCQKNNQNSLEGLINNGEYKAIVANMLNKEGLNYGNLPKGLLLFHSYIDAPRTPMEEHLVEAVLYAASNEEANIHFTVSPDHMYLFEKMVEEKAGKFADRFGIRFNVTFSVQKPSTDTIAANLDNSPFRNDDGSLLFRPGGHGALIENLNEIDADIVFIKNIDNVVPDRLKDDTVIFKQLLAGILVEVQKKIFSYLNLLDSGIYNHVQLEEMIRFVQRDLCCRKLDIKELEDAELVIYLRRKLNRPIRVCGVVKNVGEAGGGPFLTYNSDGTISLQILESSQIDKDNAEYVKMFKEGIHFNPVDLVCAIKDYQGEAFDLKKFVDSQTGFISAKSKDGRDLKALELPGLWNGAMSDWNTIFVEVPLSTFNPVKTVNDLLREAHQ